MWTKSATLPCVLAGALVLAVACGSSGAAPASHTTGGAPAAHAAGGAPASASKPQAGSTSAPSPGKTVTLSFSTQDPGPHTPLDKSFVYFAQQVGKQTNGKVTIKIYWGGSLVGGGSVLTGVQNDTADSAQLITPYFPGQLPLWSVGDSIPFNGLTDQKALAVGRAMLAQVPALSQEISKFNQVLVSLSPTSAYGMWSKGPLRTLSDLRGLKVRTNGVWIPKVFTAVGAKPVSLKGPDIYTAIQRGTISGVYFPVAFGELFKLNEVAHYFTNIGFGSHALSGAITINKTVWDTKLTAQERTTIMKVGQETENYLVSQMQLSQQQDLQTLKQQHVTYESLPKSSIQKWAALPAVVALRNQWVKSTNAKGLPGTKTMAAFVKLAGLH